jgi:hypothetical protein
MRRLKPLLVTRGLADAAPAEMFVEITLRLMDPRQEATNCIGGSKRLLVNTHGGPGPKIGRNMALRKHPIHLKAREGGEQ